MHVYPSFHMEDGVTCEACHGPSSDYSTYSAMRDQKVFLKLGGVLGSEHDCYGCHAAHMSDAHCPFQYEPFAAGKAMAAIAHPVPRKNGTR
jgi:hypothetical protein